ncbi:hypothetical protein RSSM_02527 [Rhodopirellula sallentina SM41]|uniref:Uncharacterized protein n=1 Tax=Rhodopirellula sallentina SM41 TaxID=1263870 RepID=M5U423_9BACT|nr:hypothetical protein RSSM_02527 [Rhodopirellula sallentina SM41]
MPELRCSFSASLADFAEHVAATLYHADPSSLPVGESVLPFTQFPIEWIAIAEELYKSFNKAAVEDLVQTRCVGR